MYVADAKIIENTQPMPRDFPLSRNLCLLWFARTFYALCVKELLCAVLVLFSS
jgi:hypothetical protein